MKFTNQIGAFLLIEQEQLPSGNWRIHLIGCSPEGRMPPRPRTIYRRRQLDLYKHWQYKDVAFYRTYYVGCLVVTAWREAIAAGQVTKAVASQLSQALAREYCVDWVHRSREAQDKAARALFDLTRDQAHYMTDAWLVNGY
jgi:hypothetical protein